MNRDHKRCTQHPNWIRQEKLRIEKIKLQKLERIENYNKNPKLCKYCNSGISYYKQLNSFCSHSCRARFYADKKEKLLKICKCLYCNKEIDIRKTWQTTKKYCDHHCQMNDYYKKYIEKWKKGEEVGLSGDAVSDHIRRYLFEKYSNKCCNCGWCEINKSSNKIPLQVNHIDGNYKNNKEENLELLCPNCHSLTPNFGALNRGNGRDKRRERYNLKLADLAKRSTAAHS